MKSSVIIVMLLLVASPCLVLAADAHACRQLLMSQLPDEEGARADQFFDDAEKVYRDCRGAALPVDIRVKALLKYGTAHYVRGHVQTAISAFHEAIDILDAASGDQTPMLLEVLDRAVMAETDAAVRSDAIAHAGRALSLRETRFGKESEEAVTGMVKLALVHATFGDYVKSESLLRPAIRIAEKTCGPECAALAEAYSGMSAFYAAQGNDAEAKKYEEMVINATPTRKRVSRGKD